MIMHPLARAALLVAAALALALPLDALAQGQGRGKAKGHDKQSRESRVRTPSSDDRADRDERRRGRRDRDDRVVLDDGRVIIVDRDRGDQRVRANRRGNAPKFCRTGAGHPVHGRRWCVEKGFGLGDRGDVFFDDGRVFLQEDDEVRILRGRVVDERPLWRRALDRAVFWND